MNDNGLFIVFEGIDGCGKSTQSAKLAEWLENITGKKVVRTAEPYILRELILGRKDLSNMTELLLFLADRAEHVERVIKPNLEAGNFVICERYRDSTFAYQCGGHDMPIDKVSDLMINCSLPIPDVKIFLDITPEIAFERVKARNNQNDKFEAEGLEFMKKVAEFYKYLPDFIKISCDNLNEDEVFKKIITEMIMSINPRGKY